MVDRVDLALCLAIDCSSSVDFDEFGLMMQGYGAAFADPAVQAAIAAGPAGAIGISVILWSGPGAVDLALPWTRAAPDTASALGQRIADLPRSVPPGATALGDGLAAALAAVMAFPGQASRLVIDVSGDGRRNAGRAVEPVRDLAVATAVTVNALAIVNEEPALLAYYGEALIGGHGAFAMVAQDYEAFADAILRKLLREIRGPAALA
jgi:hypothetical protein